ncbi:MAG: tetratricopeptide repeat protein [Candidatus Coatesbacteria bacterium]|nr:tetratricopeptide repeat protein [Candidatus Coatesbacteria bacterium]
MEFLRKYLVFILLALALAIKIIYIIEVKDNSPFIDIPFGDAKYYIGEAEKLVNNGNLTPEPFFHSAPVYIIFLFLMISFAGKSFIFIRIVQVLIGIINLFLVYKITLVYSKKWHTAIIAVIIAILYAPLTFHEVKLLETPIVLLGLLAGIYLLSREHNFLITYLAGISFGIAALGKPNIAYVSVFIVAYEFYCNRKEKKAFLKPLLLLLGLITVISPVAVRNYLVSGELVPISTNGGINFYIGNYKGSDGAFTVPSDPEFIKDKLDIASREVARKLTGKQLTAEQSNIFWYKEGFSEIAKNPTGWLKLLLKKIMLFFGNYEIPNKHDFNVIREYFAPILWFLPLNAPIIFGLAAFSLFFINWKDFRLSLIIILLIFITIILLFNTGRYRLPVIVLSFPLAASAISKIYELLKLHHYKILLRVFIPVAIISSLLYTVPKPFNESLYFTQLGNAYIEKKDKKNAVNMYQKAINLSNKNHAAYCGLGKISMDNKNPQNAKLLFTKALSLNPENSAYYFNLGNAELAMLQYDSSIDAYKKSLAINPNNASAYNNLSYAYAMTNNFDKAEEANKYAIQFGGEKYYKMSSFINKLKQRNENKTRKKTED